MILLTLIVLSLPTVSSPTAPPTADATLGFKRGVTAEASLSMGTGFNGDLALNLWLNEQDIMRVQLRALTTQELFNTSPKDLDAELLMLGYRRRFVEDTSKWTDAGFFLEAGAGFGQVTRYAEPCRSGFLGSVCEESTAWDYALNVRFGYSLAARSFMLIEPFVDVTSVGPDVIGLVGIAFQLGVAAGS